LKGTGQNVKPKSRRLGCNEHGAIQGFGTRSMRLIKAFSGLPSITFPKNGHIEMVDFEAVWDVFNPSILVLYSLLLIESLAPHFLCRLSRYGQLYTGATLLTQTPLYPCLSISSLYLSLKRQSGLLYTQCLIVGLRRSKETLNRANRVYRE